MKLVVGLGNPGEKYKNTRHNVGALVVDRLKVEFGEEVKWLKPDKFMNKSGVALKAFLKKNPRIKMEDVYVVHDDLDIELGKYKISFSKGPKDHNGLNNIYEQVGSHDFWHVRVGVDGERDGKSGEEYVLSNWRPEEREVIKKVTEEIVEELKNVFT